MRGEKLKKYRDSHIFRTVRKRIRLISNTQQAATKTLQKMKEKDDDEEGVESTRMDG